MGSYLRQKLFLVNPQTADLSQGSKQRVFLRTHVIALKREISRKLPRGVFGNPVEHL